MYPFASNFEIPHMPYIMRPVSFLSGHNPTQETGPTRATAVANASKGDTVTSSILPSKKRRRRAKQQSPPKLNMTTYYSYNLDGSITGYTMEPMSLSEDANIYTGAPVYSSIPWQPNYPYLVAAPFHSLSEDYTDERDPAPERLEKNVEDVDHGYYSDDVNVDYVGYTISDSGSTTQIERHQTPLRQYPEPEEIRRFHDLHSLLPWIQPARLHNALFGPTVDIVEEETGAVFAYKVPKKLLILFCGRLAITKFLRTLERDDNEWQGGPKVQELRIPRGTANHVGVKVLIAWMKRASYENTSAMEAIRVPKNLFAAISLARTMELLGLHRDACRVDNIIASHHLKRPLYPDEIKSIWLCLPKDSKYTYRMVQDLHDQLSEYEGGVTKALREADTVLKFLEEQPDLNARVRNQQINDNFQPIFGTEWCKKVTTNERGKDVEPMNMMRKFSVLRIVPAKREMVDKGTVMSNESVNKSAEL